MEEMTNVSLPLAVRVNTKNQTDKQKKNTWLRNFFRRVIREYREWKLFFELKKSQREFRAGKAIKLNSLADLD